MLSSVFLATMMLLVQAGQRQASHIDVTGYWVSVITEDWRWRMLTPPKGDYASVPLNRSSPNNERLIQDKSKVREEIGDLLD
jgi:hypothetical protein